MSELVHHLSMFAQATPGVSASYAHVKGHSGDPWNDLADFVAKTASSHQHTWPAPPNDLCVALCQQDISWLAPEQDARVHHALPCLDGALVWAPPLPGGNLISPENLVPTTSAEGAAATDCATFQACFATINVQSLSKKCQYIEEQLHARSINVACLQETKLPGGTLTSKHYLRLHTHADSHWGVAVWIHRKLGLCRSGDAVLTADENDVAILHEDPRLIALLVTIGEVRVGILSGHCPHAHRAEERDAFLKTVGPLLQRVKHANLVIGGFDLNGRVPISFSGVSGNLEFGDPDEAGWHFASLLAEGGMWIPSMYHCGDSATYTHPNGQQHRIDYVFLGGQAVVEKARSEVDDSFDNGSPQEDHKLLTLSLQGMLDASGRVRHRAKLWRDILIRAFAQWKVAGEGHHGAAKILQRVKKAGMGGAKTRPLSRPLPMLLHPDSGMTIATRKQRDQVWMLHFGKQEQGSATNIDDFLAEAQWSCYDGNVIWDVGYLPSYLDIEKVLHDIPRNKAAGLDNIPGEVLKAAPAAAARALLPLFVKSMLTQHQPVQWRGGVLFEAFKRSGLQSSVDNYRSLFVSSYVAKAYHRVVRNKAQQYSRDEMHPLHLGSKKLAPVTFAALFVLSHFRRCHSRHRSASVLYLDTSAAYYRIVRELAVGDIRADDTVLRLFHRFGLSGDDVQELLETVQAGGMMAQAGAPEALQQVVKDIHLHTWFVTRSSWSAGNGPWKDETTVIAMILKVLQKHPLYFAEEVEILDKAKEDVEALDDDDVADSCVPGTPGLLQRVLSDDRAWHRPVEDQAVSARTADLSLQSFQSEWESHDWAGLLKLCKDECVTPEGAPVILDLKWEASSVKPSGAQEVEAAFDDPTCFVPSQVRALCRQALQGLVKEIQAPATFWASPFGLIFKSLRAAVQP
ncbi:TNXB [Symbiodinium necroappetens]|uniref:TNXB protein n=1 Tax=Symbiodinium necroappetens TaxID=1628268 RepID=A0A812S335_9DINO|nr:TNXB [Symbiodinium necroappetens]